SRHHLAHGENILTVHCLTVHAIAFGADEDVLVGSGARDRGTHAVAIVLDDEDDRQIPEGSEIQRFVKCADVDRRLTEEADTQLVSTAILDGEADSGGDWNVTADNSVSTEEI